MDPILYALNPTYPESQAERQEKKTKDFNRKKKNKTKLQTRFSKYEDSTKSKELRNQTHF